MAYNDMKDLYKRINAMTTLEFTKLLDDAQSQEEKEFYLSVFNLILQQKQKKIIQAKVF